MVQTKLPETITISAEDIYESDYVMMLEKVREDIGRLKRRLMEFQQLEHRLMVILGRRVDNDRPRAQDYARWAADALVAIDGPATIGEIMDRAIVLGYSVPSDRRETYALFHSAINRRPEQFRKVKRGHWELIKS
jgi:hypothetical protein